jgi:hypothetical protein
MQKKRTGQHRLDDRQAESCHLISQMLSLKILGLVVADGICHHSCVFSFFSAIVTLQLAISHFHVPSIGNKNQQGTSTG